MQTTPDTGPFAEKNDAPTMPLRAPVDEQSSSGSKPWRLRLNIRGESHTTIGIPVKEQILLGRAHSGDDLQPELDLSAYGAVECGVSRQHAVLHCLDDESIFIEDLDSTNGTHLNGYALEAHTRYRLHDGDELWLGTLRVVIRFVTSPSSS